MVERPKGITCTDWEEASPGKRACKHLLGTEMCGLVDRFTCEEAEKRGLLGTEKRRAAPPSDVSALGGPAPSPAPTPADPSRSPATATPAPDTPEPRHLALVASQRLPVVVSQGEVIPGPRPRMEGRLAAVGPRPDDGPRVGDPLLMGEPNPREHVLIPQDTDTETLWKDAPEETLWERIPTAAVTSLVNAQEDTPERRLLRGLLGYEDPPEVWTSPPRREERRTDVILHYGKSILHVPRHWPPVTQRAKVKKNRDGSLPGQESFGAEDDGGDAYQSLQTHGAAAVQDEEEDWRTAPHLARSQEEVTAFHEEARKARAAYVALRAKEPSGSEKEIWHYWSKHLFLSYQLFRNGRRMDSSYFPDVLFRGAQYYWSLPTSLKSGRWEICDVIKSKILLRIVPDDMQFQV